MTYTSEELATIRAFQGAYSKWFTLGYHDPATMLMLDKGLDDESLILSIMYEVPTKVKGHETVIVPMPLSKETALELSKKLEEMCDEKRHSKD